MLGHWDFLRNTEEAIASYTARGAPDPTPLERHVAMFFSKWLASARKVTDPENKGSSRGEIMHAGPDRLKAALQPFFDYLNHLIESQVFQE